jgi:hypothetical protein
MRIAVLVTALAAVAANQSVSPIQLFDEGVHFTPHIVTASPATIYDSCRNGAGRALARPAKASRAHVIHETKETRGG